MLANSDRRGRGLRLLLVVLAFSLLPGAAVASLTERVSVSSTGEQGNDHSGHTFYENGGGWNYIGTSISADGRLVAFISIATNLVSPPTSYLDLHIYVHDRNTGLTEIADVSSSGERGDYPSSFPALSPDGRYVAFWSGATNLVPGDIHTIANVFLHDRQTGATEQVDLTSTGGQPNGSPDSKAPSVSAGGRFVAFASAASNLVPGDINAVTDVFVRDRVAGTTERVSVATDGTQGNGQSDWPCISADGRYVAFQSRATNLVPGVTVGAVYVRDRLLGTTEVASLSNDGQPIPWAQWPTMTLDGRYVAFFRGNVTLYVRDVQTGTTDLLPDALARGYFITTLEG